MKAYGQFCPMARAAEILCERWTLLIVRELLAGSERFNDIHRGVPLISRTVLAERLRTLCAADVIERGSDGAYRPTASGRALMPIVLGLAEWGDRHIRDELRSDQLDAGLLMWDIRRGLRTAGLPPGRQVIAWHLNDAPRGRQRWWLVAEGRDVQLCLTDPGYEPNLWLRTDLRTLTEVWLGTRDMRRCLARGAIQVSGDRALESSLPQWLPGSTLLQIRRSRA